MQCQQPFACVTYKNWYRIIGDSTQTFFSLALRSFYSDFVYICENLIIILSYKETITKTRRKLFINHFPFKFVVTIGKKEHTRWYNSVIKEPSHYVRKTAKNEIPSIYYYLA